MSKIRKRLLSAALAVILAVGLTRPAIAANDGAETADTTTQSAPVTSGDNEAAPAADLVDPQTVQIKVCRNGDTSQAYYTEKFQAEKGADVTPLIEDYYSSRYGFEVDGWFNDGGWNNYVAGNTELTAVWNAVDYTLTLDFGGKGELVNEDRTVHYGTAIGELPVGADTVFSVRENGDTRTYFISGWVDGDGDPVTAETLYSAEGNSTICAQYQMAPDSSCTTDELLTIQCSTDESRRWVVNWFGNYVNLDKKSIAYDTENQRWTAQVKFTGIFLVNAGNTQDQHFGGYTHYYDNDPVVIDLYWDAQTNLRQVAEPVVKTVYCHDAPAAPSDATIQKLQKLIWIRDTNNLKNNYRPTGLKAGTYSVGKMYTENGKFYVDLTITNLDAYIKEFEGKFPGDYGGYVINEDETTAEFTYTLVYSGDVYDYAQDGTGWTVDQAKSNMTATDFTNGKQLWVIDRYVVTYTDGAANESVFADEVHNIPLANKGTATPAFAGDYTRPGYTFQGWSPEVAETVTGNVTYTARWTANTYTITLVNGEESTTMEVTYGQPIGELPNLENAHSDFEGWFDENGNQVTGDMVYTRTENMTLTAKWTGHVMTKVEAVAPTCTEDGNIAYWYCPDCGKYFADEACTQEITLESTEIKALGHDYEDGKCTVCGEKDPDYVQPTDPEGPDQTGENTNVALLVSLLVLSAACLAVVITKSRQWKVR